MLGIRNQRRVNQPLVIGRVGEEGLLVMQMGKKGIIYNVLYHLSNICLVRGGGGGGTIISYRINSHLAEVLIVGPCEIKFPYRCGPGWWELVGAGGTCLF